MFGGIGRLKSSFPIYSCFWSEHSYSLIGFDKEQKISFTEYHSLPEPSLSMLQKELELDVNKHRLYGKSIQVILSPSFYQLIQMDAPEVIEEGEMAKALRWQLKGLVDFPLNDIAVDAFMIPPHGSGNRRKKVFVAVTLQSELLNKIKIFEDCFLNVTSVTIAEMALSALVVCSSISPETSSIVISFDDEMCQLYVYFQGDLYLCRSLPINKSITEPNSSANHDMLLEIQRSIDYCLMELKLPEPQQILFTPTFYEASDLFIFLQEELGKEVKLLDSSPFFLGETTPPETMAHSFYAIGGALMTTRLERG
jgi:Tfp pilus assembly PilM family ATPase